MHFLANGRDLSQTSLTRAFIVKRQPAQWRLKTDVKLPDSRCASPDMSNLSSELLNASEWRTWTKRAPRTQGASSPIFRERRRPSLWRLHSNLPQCVVEVGGTARARPELGPLPPPSGGTKRQHFLFRSEVCSRTGRNYCRSSEIVSKLNLTLLTVLTNSAH